MQGKGIGGMIMPEMTSVHGLLQQTVTLLQEAGIDNARKEAEIIFAETLKLPRLELYIMPDRKLSGNEKERLTSRVERRSLLHEPLQYILGRAAFRELSLSVGPGVLIPRPETELLAEYVIRHAAHNASVCDIGVGSGAIALSIAFERPDIRVTGIDVSEKALKYARRNRSRYQLKNVRLRQGNLFQKLPAARFDVVTANLPYVTAEEMDRLNRDVRDHEPELALHGGDDGLDIIRDLIVQLPDHLHSGGFVIFELGSNQAAAVKKLCRAGGVLRNVEILKDYNGIDRFVVARR